MTSVAPEIRLRKLKTDEKSSVFNNLNSLGNLKFMLT